MKTSKSAQIILGVSLALLPVTSFAATVGSKVVSTVTTSGVVGTSVVSSSTSTVTTSGNQSSSAGASANVGASVGSNANSGGNAGGNAGNATSGGITASLDSGINLSQNDAMSYNGASITDVSQVADDTTLAGYASSQMKADTNITGVSLTSADVAVSYKGAGKLLGFIPVSISTTVTADNTGTATVSHPWYDFLIFKGDTNLKANLSTNLSAALQSTGNSGDQIKAQILSAIINSLQASY